MGATPVIPLLRGGGREVNARLRNSLGLLNFARNLRAHLRRCRFVAAVLLLCLAATPLDVAAQEVARDQGAPASTAVLRSLYMTTVVVQGLDTETSLTAFRLGAVEQNPLLRPFVSSRPAFVAAKTGIAAAMILVAHNTAKHSRTKAIIEMVVMNAAYGAFVAHNYRVIKQMRAQQGQ
jgi:hypothetical protein